MIALQTITITAILIFGICHAKPVGYSYAKFSGPVSGPEQEVVFHDGHTGHGHVDYVAKPDYHFAYGVEDPKTNVQHNRKESRNGDTLTGEYSVADPDGTVRIVKYTADDVNGFHADVITQGHPSTQSYSHGSPVATQHEYYISDHAQASNEDDGSPSPNASYETHEEVQEGDDNDHEENVEDEDDDHSY